jgi:ATP-dependent Lhr-like helicase
VPAAVGQRPRTRGEGSPVHDRVRTEMRAVLAGLDEPVWLDESSRDVLRVARRQYRDLKLADCIQVTEGKSVYLFLWRGDAIQNGLVTLLQHHGLEAENWGICVVVKKINPPQLTAVLQAIAASPCPRPDQVFNRKAIGNPEKWDWALPDRLFYASFASVRLDLVGAHACCEGWERSGDSAHEPAPF